MSSVQRSRRPARRSAGFSLIEVVISTMLVGLVLVGAVQALGGLVRGRASVAELDRAKVLATDLLAEVLENEYADPDEPPVFGAESSENSATRAAFDDIDDFQSWDATPPVDRAGAALANGAGWRRKVVVDYVDPNNLNATVVGDQGVKRIQVEVYKDGTLQATQTSYRTSGWKGPR